MSWQDEQRELQEQYERGEISAQEFRTRRQHLLSAASAGPTESTRHPGSETTQAMRPVSPPAQPPSGHERTQAVPPPQHTGDPDRTQIVPPATWQPGAPPPGVYGNQPPPPPGRQPPEAPPWSGSEFPPLVASGSQDWPGHGPDIFARKRSNRNAFVALAVAVVVLAGLGVGGYFLFGRSGTAEASPQSGGGAVVTSTPQGTRNAARPTRTRQLFPIGDMPVKPNIREDVTSVAQFGSLNYFTDAELQAYHAAGASEAKMAVFTVGDGTLVTLILAKAENPQAAYTAAKKLNEIQIHNGRKENSAEPAGVRVAEIEANPDVKQPAGIRAHYSHDDVIVRVDVKGKSLDDLTPIFNTVLAAELKVLAPDA